MFDLVERVEDYPRFLPWCGDARVLQRGPEGMVATLVIAYRGLNQSFTTENVHERPRAIRMRLRDGPFSALAGEWRFVPLSADACRVEFELEYAFGSVLVGRLVGPVFDQIAATFVDAFVRRADQAFDG
jgi:ribosome-associated toxin RatA of RatAB toxin-antitoxin module